MQAIDPSVWGASGWSVLHRLSFCFTRASEAASFYKTLELLLPCPKCQRNMRDHFEKLPLPRKATDFPEWVWKLHNRVSESLCERSQVTTPTTTPLEEVVSKYSSNDTCHQMKACEAKFLLAIAETHPGARSRNARTTEYFAALRTFINTYNAKSGVDVALSDATLRSRSAFRNWIQKQTKSREHFRECVAS